MKKIILRIKQIYIAHKKIVNIAVGLLLLLIAAVSIIALDSGCVFRKTFGIICPSCGLSRAVLSLCRLDFAGAFYYHPMVYSLPILLLYVLKNGRAFKNRYINRGVAILIAVGFIVCYIARLNFNYL
ncbi:MAG TPA: DUF2752 domain-containing protein [Clostridiales bacterium]|nr:DUF2752 domain-containing protein [Clostridiales bacterium]